MTMLRRVALVLAMLAALLAGWLWHVNVNDGVDISTGLDAASGTDGAALRARGADLARAGNCMACHTARGGTPYAGGRPIETPFGTLFSSNLTPDPRTGLGAWTAGAFWRALHHGRSRDGRLLYPAFPYTHTTLLTRADSDALFAHLQALPPTPAEPPAAQLRWPYGTQAALAIWRALYFKPGNFSPDPSQSADWNRGAYLVRGVAHCSACHATRDALAGADWQTLTGGQLLAQGWYAPSLHATGEASVAQWPLDDIVRLLKTGQARGAGVSGPMAEVVLHGTQYLSESDLTGIATYLKSLPQHVPAAPSTAAAPAAPRAAVATAGGKLYGEHCASCHGERGEGVAGAYPALAGNRAVTLGRADNLVQMVLHGGFAPATAGNPRPFGMPPFVLTLSDHDIAAVLTHIRSNWGNRAAEVTPLDVHAGRAGVAIAAPR